jgi:hypothetical protein
MTLCRGCNVSDLCDMYIRFEIFSSSSASSSLSTNFFSTALFTSDYFYYYYGLDRVL